MATDLINKSKSLLNMEDLYNKLDIIQLKREIEKEKEAK